MSSAGSSVGAADVAKESSTAVGWARPVVTAGQRERADAEAHHEGGGRGGASDHQRPAPAAWGAVPSLAGPAGLRLPPCRAARCASGPVSVCQPPGASARRPPVVSSAGRLSPQASRLALRLVGPPGGGVGVGRLGGDRRVRLPAGRRAAPGASSSPRLTGLVAEEVGRAGLRAVVQPGRLVGRSARRAGGRRSGPSDRSSRTRLCLQGSVAGRGDATARLRPAATWLRKS